MKFDESKVMDLGDLYLYAKNEEDWGYVIRDFYVDSIQAAVEENDFSNVVDYEYKEDEDVLCVDNVEKPEDLKDDYVYYLLPKEVVLKEFE